MFLKPGMRFELSGAEILGEKRIQGCAMAQTVSASTCRALSTFTCTACSSLTS